MGRRRRASRAMSPSTPRRALLDAMQADLVGFSLALAPGQAPATCRCSTAAIPISSAAASCRGRSRSATRSRRSSRCFEDPSRPQDRRRTSNTTALVLKRHGIEVAPFDDTMLISYVLDAGKGSHGMDELSRRHLGHTPISFGEVAGTGRARVTFDKVDDRQGAPPTRPRTRTSLCASGSVLKPRLAPSGAPPSTRRWSGRSSTCSRAWRCAASRSTGRSCRGSRAISRRPWRGSRTRSTRSPARSSPSARRSRSATSCSARWVCPARRRRRPGQWATPRDAARRAGPGGPRAARRRSWNGASSPS